MFGSLRKRCTRLLYELPAHNWVSRWLVAVALFTSMQTTWADIAYEGTLGKQGIHVYAQCYGDGVVRAMYVYDKFDIPIQLNGRLDHGMLELKKKNNRNTEIATFKFEHFDTKQEKISGEWYKTDLSIRLPVTLKKEIDSDRIENPAALPYEQMQSAATQEHYFKTVATKKDGDFSPRIYAVKVFKKGTDALLQTFDVDALENLGMDSISVGDFNFDGIEDFSVFESSYAGPDTTSLYFLNSGDKRYIKSDFGGVSLEFDPTVKRIYEHSQCCAGSHHMTAIYKVVRNKMVLLKSECWEPDQKTDVLVPVKCY